MIDGQRVIGLIPARAGSQRLPGKNMRLMAGRPLVDWTLGAALDCPVLDRVVVTTDDPAVADWARGRGVEVVDRPGDLAGAEAAVVDAITHALTTVGGAWDYVVLLQPTSPLRTAGDISGAVALCHQRGAPAVIAASPPMKPATFHRRQGADGTLTPAAGQGEIVVINGAVYVGRPARLARDRRFDVEGALIWPMPAERGWDIDTAAEFAAAEAVARQS